MNNDNDHTMAKIAVCSVRCNIEHDQVHMRAALDLEGPANTPDEMEGSVEQNEDADEDDEEVAEDEEGGDEGDKAEDCACACTYSCMRHTRG